MGFEAPRLDDRSFNDIVEEALRLIPLYVPEWTDHNLSDPGITLIELFAWMTDIILYRLNRVPDKHFIKFMELIGMRLQEAEPATVPVTFWLTAPQPGTVTIPTGTAVATTRTETDPAITFTTSETIQIYVPTLLHIMTSRESANRQRHYSEHNTRRVVNGRSDFEMFESDPPAPGDALYLGFEENLSHHLLGINFEVNTAEGAGVIPEDPPYIWEVPGTDDVSGWIPAEVDMDDTSGLNVNGLVRLHLPAMQRVTRQDKTAYWVRCRILSPDETTSPLYRISPRVKRMEVESWGITIESSNVSIVNNEILGRSDGTPGQRFYLAHTPVVPRLPGEYLIVRQENGEEERWTEVSDFARSGNQDRHYTVESTTGEVRLAPALPQRDGTIRRYGAVPPRNAMLIMRSYRYGGGHAGNVAASTLNVLKSALPYVERVSNRRPAQGGLDTESLEDCKLRVPGYLRSLGRAVTPADYEFLARQAAPGRVSRARCVQTPGSTGEVDLLIIPEVPNFQGYIAPESLILRDELRQQISDFLDERRLLATRLNVLEPRYQWVQTEIRLHPAINADPETVARNVIALLYHYLNPLVGGERESGWQFGRSLYPSDLVALLLDMPGVDFIRGVQLHPVSYHNGEFNVEEAVDEIPVDTHGVIVSYEHIVVVE